MKAALLTPTFSGFSGIDRVVYDQACQLMSNGDQVEIFAFASDMEPPGGAILHVFGMPRSLFWQRVYRLVLPLFFWSNSKLASQISGFDIIYSHQYPMNWLAYLAAKKYKTKYVYYDYGVAPANTFASIAERIYMSIFTRLSNWTAKKADSAVSISIYLKEELRKDIGLVSEVVYPRIDTGRFNTGIDGAAIRMKYAPGDGLVILYIGRISPHKGVHLLIKAFMEVKREIPGARLLVVGKHTFNKYSQELKSLAGASVVFAGYVPDEDIPRYYAASDVYATATLWEGFDLPLAEAQACGKPVVAFNIGPHAEVVIEGKTGYLVKTGDTGEMARAVIRLLKDPAQRRNMGNKASAFIKEKFA